MTEIRLGDDVDDFCVKCRRVTNHAVVSVVNNEAAKVRCRTCYHDHDFRHEQAPPSKKDLKKAELANAALAGAIPAAGSEHAEHDSEAPMLELALEPSAEIDEQAASPDAAENGDKRPKSKRKSSEA